MTQDNAFSHLRLFAAALVLYSHHFALWGQPEPMAFGLTLGLLGVAVFFGISGYLVTLSLAHDPDPLRFLSRRLLRIMPGLALNTVFCAVLLGAWLSTLPLTDYFTHPEFGAYFWNLAFSPRYTLPGVLADAPMPQVVNGSLWTLPLEMLAYLMLMVLLLACAHRPALLRWLDWVLPCLLAAMLVLALVWQPAQPHIVWGSDLRHAPRFMALFLAGACLARWQPRLPSQASWLGLLVLMLVLVLLYAAVPLPELRLGLLSLLLPLASVMVGSLRLPPARVLRHDVSYGVYLYAFPVQQAVISVASPLGLWPTMLLAAAITVGLACLSWWVVERPALRLKPGRRVTAAR